MELIDDRPFANFAQPNHFGLLMVMAVVAVAGLFEMLDISVRWVLHAALAFFGWGILISESRASLLALVAVGACWLSTRRSVPTRLRLNDVAIAIFIMFLLAWIRDPLQHALLIKGAEARSFSEVGPRYWIWVNFWAAISARPWFGYGFNQGVLALAEVAKQVHPSRNTIYAHNFVLDLMVWLGIPLALVMVVALLRWMFSWLRACPDVARMAQSHWVFAIWLALLVQSMFEFPFAHAYFLLPAALLAGAITRPGSAMKIKLKNTAIVANFWVMALAAGASILLAVTVYEYFQMESDFRVNRFFRANFHNIDKPESRRKILVLDQLEALNLSAHFKLTKDMSPETLEQMRVLARRFHILSVRFEYAKALALNGKSNQAEDEMGIIRSIYPPVQYAAIEREWRSWLSANSIPFAKGSEDLELSGWR